MVKPNLHPFEMEAAKASPLYEDNGEREEVEIYLRIRISVPKGRNPDGVSNILTGLLWKHEPHINRIHRGEWWNKEQKIVYIE